MGMLEVVGGHELLELNKGAFYTVFFSSSSLLSPKLMAIYFFFLSLSHSPSFFLAHLHLLVRFGMYSTRFPSLLLLSLVSRIVCLSILSYTQHHT